MENRIYGNETEGQYEFSAEGMTLFLMAGDIATPKGLPVNMAEKTRDAGHTHFWYELFYVRRGAIRLCLEQGERRVSEGELLLVAPGTVHHAEPIAERDVEQYVFSFSVKAHQKTVTVRQLTRLLSFSGVCRFSPSGECGMLAAMLVNALTDGKGALGCACLLTLLLQLAEGGSLGAVPMLTRIGVTEQGESAHSDNTASRLYRLEGLLGRTYTANVSLATMAEAMHLSERQLARIIRRQYGCTYYEQVTHLRMKTAQQLLASGKHTVAEIAARIGYATYGGFTVAYRRYYGMTPAAYRKSLAAALAEKHGEEGEQD